MRDHGLPSFLNAILADEALRLAVPAADGVRGGRAGGIQASSYPPAAGWNNVVRSSQGTRSQGAQYA